MNTVTSGKASGNDVDTVPPLVARESHARADDTIQTKCRAPSDHVHENGYRDGGIDVWSLPMAQGQKAKLLIVATSTVFIG